MMFHTMELHLDISYEDYWMLDHKFFNEEESNAYRDRDTGHAVCHGLKTYGISELRLVRSHEGRSYYGLWIVVNPKRVLDQENYTDVFKGHEADQFITKANLILSRFVGKPIDIRKAQINRIDVCANVRLKDEDEVTQYLSLLRRGNVPGGYIHVRKYQENRGKKKVWRKIQGSFVLESQSVRINIYSKAHKAKAEWKKKKYQYPDADKMANILRFEIQMLKGKVRAVMDSLRIHSLLEFFKRGDEIAVSVFSYYLRLMYGEGDFINICAARELVMFHEGKYKPKTIRRIIDIINLVSLRRSLCTGINEYAKEQKMKHLRQFKLLRCFDDIGISPITIPRDWRVMSYPNPLKLVLKEFQVQDERFKSDGSFSHKCNPTLPDGEPSKRVQSEKRVPLRIGIGHMQNCG